MNRGRDETAMVEVVDRIERDPLLLGLGPNGVVHGTIVRGGDRPAPDDHGSTPPEVEKHGVESRRAAGRCGGHCVTGTEARSASTPTRWQKSPNRSAPRRSSRYRSNSGRTAATS